MSPRVLGLDELGREVLSFIPGEAAFRPWPEVMLREEGLVEVGRFLARYHQAVGDFVPPEEIEWHVPGLRWQVGDIIRHGDLGPWNMIWCGTRLIGVIDWDLAEPGSPLADVAQFAWYGLPLRGDSHWREAGFSRPPDLRSRLETLCRTYGADPGSVLDTLLLLQTEEARRIGTFGKQDIHPWSVFYQRGDQEQVLKEADWLKARYHTLVG